MVIVVLGQTGAEGFKIAYPLVQAEYRETRLWVSESSLPSAVIPNEERPSSTGGNARVLEGSVCVILCGGIPEIICEDGNAQNVESCGRIVIRGLGTQSDY